VGPKESEAVPDKASRESPRRTSKNSLTRIWIDLDNTPHVIFFPPIINALHARGYQVSLTTRDAFQVCELADQMGLAHTRVGRHYGKNPILKIAGLVWRACRLIPFCWEHRPTLALSHGARSQLLLSNLIRIPTVLIADYEHAIHIPFGRPKWMVLPQTLSEHRFPIKSERLKFYRGIKEDVYVPSFRPAPAFLSGLGLSDDEVLATVRPPANEAHYYSPESDLLFKEFMSRVCQTPGVKVVLLPRNLKQEVALRANFPSWFASGKTFVPKKAVKGLDLLWSSDLVVSGGGTMNREAAALGVPVFSIFRGRSGAVDRALEKEGRLIMIRNPKEVWEKIPLIRRDRSQPYNTEPKRALEDIIEAIEEIIEAERERS
jgi:predicted glycosyltransferase